MHFDFGQEAAGVTDRMIVFERLVGEHETSSGEALGVKVKCAPRFWRVPPDLSTHLLLTCGSRPDHAIMRQTSGKLLSGETVMRTKPFNANGRSANGNRRCVQRQRQERQGQGQRKAQGKHENSPKFEGYCGHCGKWRHKAGRLLIQEHCGRSG